MDTLQVRKMAVSDNKPATQAYCWSLRHRPTGGRIALADALQVAGLLDSPLFSSKAESMASPMPLSVKLVSFVIIGENIFAGNKKAKLQINAAGCSFVCRIHPPLFFPVVRA